MHYKNAAECWSIIREETGTDLLPEIERFARENRSPARIVFGTSGWRDEIGTGFTFRNVEIVTRAIINTLKSNIPAVREALGVRDFSDIQRMGIIVGHDNRFLGPDFAESVMRLFNDEDIKVYYGGETTTPEISASVEMLGAASAVNITPSHNPSNYQGIKFNPADGGPAGPEITDVIQQDANRLMNEAPEEGGSEPNAEYIEVDTTDLYQRYLLGKGTIDLEKVREFVIRGNSLIVVDHVHGASRGRPERLLGITPEAPGLDRLDLRRGLVLLRKENDYLFGGVAPEPSSANLEMLQKVLEKSSADFRIGVIIDPDGDRIRFADHTRQISMNYFGAMALHFLHVYKGIDGVAVKSVGTSNLVNAVAKKHGIPVRETKVGFKNFRPYMLPDAAERAIVAFEESDGLSGYQNTLEKDALFGLLLAIEMVATTGKNLGDYLTEIMDEYGHYYPDRSGIEVDRTLAGEELKKRLSVIRERYPVGSTISINNNPRKVADLITVDGTKIILEDGSWLMIRPSGTEPKVRFYIEARTPEDRKAIFQTAERLTEEAIYKHREEIRN